MLPSSDLFTVDCFPLVSCLALQLQTILCVALKRVILPKCEQSVLFLCNHSANCYWLQCLGRHDSVSKQFSPHVNRINLFISTSLAANQNKLGCSSQASFFSTLRRPTNIRLTLKRPDMDKHFSLVAKRKK